MDDGEKDVMDYSMASDLPSANGIPVGIVEAEPGRRYTEWPGKRLSYSPRYARGLLTNMLLPNSRQRRDGPAVRSAPPGQIPTGYHHPRPVVGLPGAELPESILHP